MAAMAAMAGRGPKTWIEMRLRQFNIIQELWVWVSEILTYIHMTEEC